MKRWKSSAATPPKRRREVNFGPTSCRRRPSRDVFPPFSKNPTNPPVTEAAIRHWASLTHSGSRKPRNDDSLIACASGAQGAEILCPSGQHTLANHGVTLTPEDYYRRYLGYDDVGVFALVSGDRGVALTTDQIAALVAE